MSSSVEIGSAAGNRAAWADQAFDSTGVARHWQSLVGLPHRRIPALALERAELAALLDAARVEMDLPGLRAVVRFSDGSVVRASVDLADVENAVALDDSVGMPGGSTGKTFVATLTMLLVEEGLLALDDPAAKWLGGAAWFDELPNAESMQVGHLLFHSSGMGDYPATMGYNMRSVWRAIRHGTDSIRDRGTDRIRPARAAVRSRRGLCLHRRRLSGARPRDRGRQRARVL